MSDNNQPDKQIEKEKENKDSEESEESEEEEDEDNFNIQIEQDLTDYFLCPRKPKQKPKPKSEL
jgi:hypothetical protein